MFFPLAVLRMLFVAFVFSSFTVLYLGVSFSFPLFRVLRVSWISELMSYTAVGIFSAIMCPLQTCFY